MFWTWFLIFLGMLLLLPALDGEMNAADDELDPFDMVDFDPIQMKMRKKSVKQPGNKDAPSEKEISELQVPKREVEQPRRETTPRDKEMSEGEKIPKDKDKTSSVGKKSRPQQQEAVSCPALSLYQQLLFVKDKVSQGEVTKTHNAMMKNLPPGCKRLTGEGSPRENIVNFYWHYFTFQQDACVEFYEHIFVDPFVKGRLMEALAVAVVQTVLKPMRIIGAEISKFIPALIKDLPVQWQFVTIVIAFVFIFLALFLSRRDDSWTIDGKIYCAKKSPPGLHPSDRPKPVVSDTPDDLINLGVTEVDDHALGLPHLAEEPADGGLGS